ncbi:MAG TPA: DUF6508 domain-containing protein [Candidatus Binatia bacterium]|nr:DUF6508 domain-containing protein [Candidatus Binatia bacterium]
MSTSDVERLRRLAAYEAIFTSDDFSVGAWDDRTSRKDGVIEMPSFRYSSAMNRFVDEMYRLDWVVSFDWPQWAASPEGRRLLSDPEAIGSASAEDLARIITTIVREERLAEGALADAFERGVLTAIARRAGELARER